MRWTHLRDEHPTARKPHRCFLCGEAINAGEKYARRAGVGDGEFMAFAMHAECEAGTNSWDDSDWECFSEGEMDRPGSEAAAQRAAKAAELDASLVRSCDPDESDGGEW